MLAMQFFLVFILHAESDVRAERNSVKPAVLVLKTSEVNGVPLVEPSEDEALPDDAVPELQMGMQNVALGKDVVVAPQEVSKPKKVQCGKCPNLVSVQCVQKNCFLHCTVYSIRKQHSVNSKRKYYLQSDYIHVTRSPLCTENPVPKWELFPQFNLHPDTYRHMLFSFVLFRCNMI